MKKFFFKAALVLAVLLVGGYSLLPLLLSKSNVSERLIQQLESSLDGDVAIEHVSFQVFPRLSVKLAGLSLQNFRQPFSFGREEGLVQGRGRVASLHLNVSPFSLLFGQVHLRDVRFKGVDWTGSVRLGIRPEVPLDVQALQGRLERFAPGKPLPFELEINRQELGSYVIKGSFTPPRAKGKTNSFDLFIQCSKAVMSDWNPLLLLGEAPVSFNQGIFDGKISLKNRKEILRVTFDGQAADFAYSFGREKEKISSGIFSWAAEGEVKYQPSGSVLWFEDFVGQIGQSNMRVNGRLDLEELARYDLTVFSENTSLDDLPAILPMAQPWIPLYLGFSGNVGYDLLVKKDPTGSVVQGHFNLDNAALSVSDIFAKALHYPMNVDFRVSAPDGKKYAGDLDLLLKDMNLKATVLQMDATLKALELNFLTNRFSFQNLQTLFPALSGYESDGHAKLFGKGNFLFDDMQRSVYEGRLVMENLALHAREGLSIRELQGQVIFSNARVASESVTLKLNDAPLKADVLVSWSPELTYQASLEGEQLDLSFLDSFLASKPQVPAKTYSAQEFAGNTIPSFQEALALPVSLSDSTFSQEGAFGLPQEVRLPDVSTYPSRVRLSFGQVRYQDIFLNNVRADLFGKQRGVVLQNLSFGIARGWAAFGGTARLGGEKTPAWPEEYQLHGRIQGVDIAALGASFATTQEYLEGVVNSQFRLEGRDFSDWNALRGSGTVDLLQGKLKKIDFMKVLAAFQSFLILKAEEKGFTRFERMHYDFDIQNGRAHSKDIHLYSEPYEITGLGSIGFDGDLNYRLNVILNEKLSQKLMPVSLDGRRIDVPVQIYNTLAAPKFSVERAVAQELLGNVIQKGLESLFGGSKSEKPSGGEASSGPIT